MKNKRQLPALILSAIFLTTLLVGPALAGKKDSDRAWLGVYTQSIDRDLEEAFDLGTDEGVVIVDVIDDSPADEAGLRSKDIILEIDRRKIDDGEQLRDMIGDMKAGDEIEMLIFRKGKEKTLSFELGARPSFKMDRDRYIPAPDVPKSLNRYYSFSSGKGGHIGVGIQNLTDQLGEYFGVEDGAGVLVTEVFEDSPAEKAGLKAGDIIVSVDDEKVYDTGDLGEIIADMEEGDMAEIGYIRDGDEKQASVEVEEKTYGMKHFNIPDIDIRIPDLSGLDALDNLYFSDDDIRFDADQFKKEMEQLRQELEQEMKELNRELEEMKKELKEGRD